MVLETTLDRDILFPLLRQDPQFDRGRHGSLYDRGSADSYYGRPPEPHWYPDGSYHGPKVVDLTEYERAEYMAGYDDNQRSGDRKDWT